MARRKKRFGAVATQPWKGAAYKPRRFSIGVSVMRMKGIASKGHYVAVACPKLRSVRERARNRANLRRCGNAQGLTPTDAVNKALRKLAAKLK